MRRAALAEAALALALAAPAAAREAIGVYGGWGAFADAAPPRCYAIAKPVRADPGARPFASIASWPARGVRNQLHLHLSRARDPRARVTLSIGERRFDLIANVSDAWAPDVRTDQAIVAAIREGRAMTVETLAKSGTPFADAYPLRGAATAIDAASLACLGR